MQTPFPAYSGDDRYAFVCYAHDDDEIVYPELSYLNAQGVNVWYDEGIGAGRIWRAELSTFIERSSVMLFYVSRNSLGSDHCNREVNFALDEGIPVLPVYLEDTALTSDLKMGLNRVQALYRDDSDRYRQQLLSALNDLLARPGVEAPVRDPPPPVPARSPVAGVVIGAALGLAALIAGAAWLWDSPPDDGVGVPEAATPSPAPAREMPSIAVLPFRTISGAVDERFADGMTDDLITDLSQISQLFVVARNSAFVFKGQDVAPTEVASRLGIRYVLEGSVRGEGKTIRVNAQLIDGETGDAVWADRIDGDTDQPLALQDAVAASVVEALELTLSEREQRAVEYRHTSDPVARQHYQRGWALFRENTPRTFKLALEHFDKAIAQDPDYLQAHAARAAVLQASLSRDFTVKIGEWTRTLGLNNIDVLLGVLTSLRKASSRPSALTLQVQSQLALWRSNFDEAVAAAEAAIALAPNDPLGYEALSVAQTMGGNPSAGRVAIEQAMRLDPAYPNEYLLWHGLALFGEENFEAAVEPLELSMELNERDDRVLIVLASALGYLNRLEDAGRIIRILNRIQSRREDERAGGDPDIELGIDVQLDGRYTLANVDIWPFRHVSDRERLREGLRLGGLPEMGPEDNPIPLEVAGAVTVSPAEAKALFERGVAIVDVRGMIDRNIGYIPGSVPLNLINPDEFNRENLLKIVDPDQEVLFHCEGMR